MTLSGLTLTDRTLNHSTPDFLSHVTRMDLSPLLTKSFVLLPLYPRTKYHTEGIFLYELRYCCLNGTNCHHGVRLGPLHWGIWHYNATERSIQYSLTCRVNDIQLWASPLRCIKHPVLPLPVCRPLSTHGSSVACLSGLPWMMMYSLFPPFVFLKWSNCPEACKRPKHL